MIIHSFKARLKSDWKAYAGILGPFLALLMVIVLFGSLEPTRFLSFYNIKTVANQSVIVALGAIGMTLIMVSGGIDLSVGSVISLTTVIIALALNMGMPPSLAMCAGLVSACMAGLLNGLLITKLRIVPFIATLGMLEVLRGLAQLLAHEQKVDAQFSWLNRIMLKLPEASWLIFSPGVWLMLLSTLFMAWFLKYTVLGRHAFALGSNENTARLCGISIAATKWKIYALAGLFFGFAGLAQYSRLGIGDPTVAVGKELDIIAAVVIGGASLSGGKGSVLGAVLGSFLMSFLRNGCTMIGVSSPAQKIVIGSIIIFAVAFDGWRSRRIAA